MTKRPAKLLSVWIAVSSVIIIAGIVLFAILGFNFSAEKSENRKFEVRYDVVAQITEGALDKIEDACDKAFKDNNLTVTGFNNVEEVEEANGSKTGNGQFVYTFAPNASVEALQKAKTQVEAEIAALQLKTDELFVSIHQSEEQPFNEAMWRGAIAIAVGAIVALIYIAIRFGLGAALTGLVKAVHDVFLTLSVFAIARIPMYAFAPLLFGAVAAALSLILWLVQCIKMRENFKEPSFAGMSAEEAVWASSQTATKPLIGVIVAFAAIIAVCGGFASAGVRLFLLPMLLPLGVATYSAFLLAPALHVYVKAAFDKRKAKKSGYVGKEKTAKPAAKQETE